MRLRKGHTQGEYNEARRLRELGCTLMALPQAVADSLGTELVSWRTMRKWVADVDFDGRDFPSRVPIENLIGKISIRSRLLEIRGDSCQECGIDEWRGSPIGLELHRIDNSMDYAAALDNLLLLCPNCHGTTDNFRHFTKRV